MRTKEMSTEALATNLNSQLVSEKTRVKVAFEILNRVDYPETIKRLQEKEGAEK